MQIEAQKNVLLYSGGMDSFVLRHLYPPHISIFFDIGTEDSNKEKERLPEDVLIIPLPLKYFELENKIIPYRNYLFALLASNFGSRIFIGSTLGDTTKDKDYVFKSLCESILNYFSIDSHKVAHSERPYEIVMPFKHMTKTEILKQFLDSNPSKASAIEKIQKSRSCYSASKLECGTCRSCLRKYIAFYNNGISSSLNFENKISIDALEAFLLESENKNRHIKEINEIKMVIKKWSNL